MPITTHCDPNSKLNSLIKFGFSKAGVLIDTLSAPRFSIDLASFTDLMPPATQNGILITSDIFETHSLLTVEPSVLAVIS